MKDKIEMIFRKTKDGDIVAFIPYCYKVYFGDIMCYQHIGQHSEASIGFYQETKLAEKEEYKELLEELKQVYNDCKIVIKKRLNYDKLREYWI